MHGHWGGRGNACNEQYAFKVSTLAPVAPVSKPYIPHMPLKLDLKCPLHQYGKTVCMECPLQTTIYGLQSAGHLDTIGQYLVSDPRPA